MKPLLVSIAAGTAALLFWSCTKASSDSDLAFASGTVKTQSWTTSYLNAGADPTVVDISSMSDLTQTYRNGAFQVIQWPMPSGAAPGDNIRVVSSSVDPQLDSDLFLLDANGNVIGTSDSPSSVEQVSGLQVGNYNWPMQIFIGGYGPTGKVSQVTVSASIIGSEAPAASVATEVGQMQSMCSQASGTFISRSDGSRCECGGSVVTFSQFVNQMITNGQVQASAFLSACGQNSAATLVANMKSLCASGGGTFLDRSTKSRCECGGTVITYDTFNSTYVIGGQVQSSAFLNACNGQSQAQGTSTDPVTSFRNACLANTAGGAILSGTGSGSNCNCRGWTLFYAGFTSGYLAKGKAASDYQNDCSDALLQQ